MNPNAVPWLLCGALCILPLGLGTAAWFAWQVITNRYPVRQVSRYEEGGRTVVRTEWSLITREDKRALRKDDDTSGGISE